MGQPEELLWAPRAPLKTAEGFESRRKVRAGPGKLKRSKGEKTGREAGVEFWPIGEKGQQGWEAYPVLPVSMG